MKYWLLVTGLSLLAVNPLSISNSLAARPKPCRGIKLPSYLVPLGSKNTACYPRLRRLHSASIPTLTITTGAIAAIPPTYYDRRTGRVVGFAATDGKVVPYCPLSSRRTDRVLVVIRRVPRSGLDNLWYVKSSATKWVARGRNVDEGVVRLLGIDLRKFDVVTMHLGSCIQPKRARERSGLIASSRVRLFNWRHRRGRLSDIQRYAIGSTLLCGDGGSTVAEPDWHRPVLGLFLYRWSSQRIAKQ